MLRITGENTIVAAAGADVAHARFKEPAIRLQALTPMTADVTITISYVDESANNRTQAQSAWSGPIAALDTKAITLYGSDTGVRSVRATAWAVTTSNTEGVIAVHSIQPRTPAF
jgi:hypothetical protein